MARAGWLGLGVNTAAVMVLGGGIPFALTPPLITGFAIKAVLIAAKAPLFAIVGFVLIPPRRRPGYPLSRLAPALRDPAARDNP